jgi:hypothetical protein
MIRGWHGDARTLGEGERVDHEDDRNRALAHERVCVEIVDGLSPTAQENNYQLRVRVRVRVRVMTCTPEARACAVMRVP